MADTPPRTTFQLSTFPQHCKSRDGFGWCVRKYEAETGWRLLAEGWHPSREEAMSEGEEAWRRASLDWGKRNDSKHPVYVPEYRLPLA
jgi:hypothetical protein